MTPTTKLKSWLPSSTDKYLPVWVVAIMFIAVWALSAQMTAAIKDICKIKNRCYDAVSVRENSSITEVVGDVVRKAVEAKVAGTMGAEAASAASAPK